MAAAPAPVYTLALLRGLDVSEEIFEYLAKIDATLEPHGGRFVIHGGGRIEVIEGEFDGFLVVLEFPDRDSAHAWYASDAYREILPLRTRNSTATAMIVDGVPAGYRATDLLELLRGADGE